jgi:tRNA threonylcarbamoyladenosine biosynthesis protein TsaB
MTLFLAMDTATDYGSVAIGEPGDVLAELQLPKRHHAANLMPAVLEILSRGKRELSDIAGIIVADGPGSFTGLRIGLATAKGILRELRPAGLFTAPSLLSTAYGARHLCNGPVAALYDALRGDVFGAVYQFRERSVHCDLAPTLGTPEELQDRCPATPSLVVGEGALLYEEHARIWSSRQPVGPPELAPRASNLIELLAIDGAVRSIRDPASFEPEYGRLAEAQVRLECARRGE